MSRTHTQMFTSKQSKTAERNSSIDVIIFLLIITGSIGNPFRMKEKGGKKRMNKTERKKARHQKSSLATEQTAKTDLSCRCWCCCCCLGDTTTVTTRTFSANLIRWQSSSKKEHHWWLHFLPFFRLLFLTHKVHSLYSWSNQAFSYQQQLSSASSTESVLLLSNLPNSPYSFFHSHSRILPYSAHSLIRRPLTHSVVLPIIEEGPRREKEAADQQQQQSHSQFVCLF